MISIIVPVYNGEQFIGRCIDSILSQTCQDWELILVNDGSRDKSGTICDEYQKKDSRIKVIHQENGGVSRARNRGLEEASGEYLAFVDADDYIVPELLDTALSNMTDVDICMFDAVTVWDNGTTEQDTIPLLTGDCELSKEDLTPELLLQMAGAIWRCMYRRKLVEDLRFPAGIKFSEDRIYNLYAMGRMSKMRYLKRGLYSRVMQSESAVHRYHEDYFEAFLLAHRATQKALAEVWPEEAYSIAYDSQFILGAICAVGNYCYKTSPLTFRQRIQKTKQLCANEELQEALGRNSAGGIRAKLMRRKMVLPLLVLAKMANIKHGQ